MLLEADDWRSAGPTLWQVHLAAGLNALELPRVALGDVVLVPLLARPIALAGPLAPVAVELTGVALRCPEGCLHTSTLETMEVGDEDVVFLPQEEDDLSRMKPTRLAQQQRVGARQLPVAVVLLPLEYKTSEVVGLFECGDLLLVSTLLEHAQV